MTPAGIFSTFSPHETIRTAIRKIVTEVYCSYAVHGQIVAFRRNADSACLRFEDALRWTKGHAPIYGVTDIHAVFELTRHLNPMFLYRTFPDGFVDKRTQKHDTDTRAGTCGVAAPLPRPLPTSRLQRNPAFRNAKYRRSARRGNAGIL